MCEREREWNAMDSHRVLECSMSHTVEGVNVCVCMCGCVCVCVCVRERERERERERKCVSVCV